MNRTVPRWGHRHIAAAMRLLVSIVVWTITGSSLPSHAAERGAEVPAGPDASIWDVTAPQGQTRTIDFTTDEGTWMSLSVSPDGSSIVFDLLGHIYKLSSQGGTAEVLTQQSGIALNYDPEYAPDGTRIAFISDRAGKSDLWVMNADGTDPRRIGGHPRGRAAEPEWSPDGKTIYVRFPVAGLWAFTVATGKARHLVGGEEAFRASPSASADGRYLYFQGYTGSSPAYLEPLDANLQVMRLDLHREGADPEIVGNDRWGEMAPRLSPDGRHLAFVRRIPGGTIKYRGHQFGPRASLWIRNLVTGATRLVADPVATDIAEGRTPNQIVSFSPRYSWFPDGESIAITRGGKILRVWIGTGAIEEIPFEARVLRHISAQARSSRRISDAPLELRFLRWMRRSPSGDSLLFQAVNKLWIKEGDASPRPLLGAEFDQPQYHAAFSADGRHIAFTTWDSTGRGHLWRARADGTDPVRLSKLPGEYHNPVWSSDGDTVYAVRNIINPGPGQAVNLFQRFYVVAHDALANGEPRILTSALNRSKREIPTLSVATSGRVFFTDPVPGAVDDFPAMDLVSIDPKDGGRQVRMRLPHAGVVAVSPDEQWVAAEILSNVYLLPMPSDGDRPTITFDQIVSAEGPNIRRVSAPGGIYPYWEDQQTLAYSHTNRLIAYDMSGGGSRSIDISLTLPRSIPKETIVLRGARIVTLAEQGIVAGDLVIEGARIRCVGECDLISPDRVIDVEGAVIIPGLIDTHGAAGGRTNVFTPARSQELAANLAYGVTTSIIPVTWSHTVFPYADLIDTGGAIGPRIFTAGDKVRDLTRKDVWGAPIPDYQSATEIVQRLKDWGASLIITQQHTSDRTRSELQMLVVAARDAGLPVTAHGIYGGLEVNLSLAMDGYTAKEHSMAIVPQYQDVTRFFGQANFTHISTVANTAAGRHHTQDLMYGERDLSKDSKLRRFWRTSQLLRGEVLEPPKRAAWRYHIPLVAEAVSDIVAWGGHSTYGTEGANQGIAMHWEMWLMAAAREPMDVLRSASADAAEYIGVDQDLGTLEAGKLADLLILNSDPLENIRNTADIRYVMQGGVLYDAATLDEISPNVRSFGEYDWVERDMLRDDARELVDD